MPTRGYYIRIGSWWVVIWRHLELALCSWLIVSCGLLWLVHESLPRNAVRSREWCDTCSNVARLSFCPSPSLSILLPFHWIKVTRPLRNCQSIWQLIWIERRINYLCRLRTLWVFLILRFGETIAARIKINYRLHLMTGTRSQPRKNCQSFATSELPNIQTLFYRSDLKFKTFMKRVE